MNGTLFTTEGLLGRLRPSKVGKVRDIYDFGPELLIVATDRMSTYDRVHPTAIPEKGRVLTELSIHWFNTLVETQPHHLITADTGNYPPYLRQYAGLLARRSMLVHKATPLIVECVIRGYLYGSGHGEYLRNGSVCGIKLPSGLRQADELPEPIFTPSTKAQSGDHDVNITEKQANNLIGESSCRLIKERGIRLYVAAAEYARRRGIIIADTKFEFGYDEHGQLILIDEVLNCDSSRFWPVEDYSPGKSQPSFDKQPVRDYGDRIGWDHNPPAPALPPEIVAGTTERYLEARRRLIGTIS